MNYTIIQWLNKMTYDRMKYMYNIYCMFNIFFNCILDSDGWTPLHCAASAENIEIVKYLVRISIKTDGILQGELLVIFLTKL